MRLLLSGHVVDAFRLQPFAPLAAAVVGFAVLRAAWLVWRDGHLGALGKHLGGRVLVTSAWAVLGLEVALWALRLFGGAGGLPAVD